MKFLNIKETEIQHSVNQIIWHIAGGMPWFCLNATLYFVLMAEPVHSWQKMSSYWISPCFFPWFCCLGLLDCNSCSKTTVCTCMWIINYSYKQAFFHAISECSFVFAVNKIDSFGAFCQSPGPSWRTLFAFLIVISAWGKLHKHHLQLMTKKPIWIRNAVGI